MNPKTDCTIWSAFCAAKTPQQKEAYLVTANYARREASEQWLKAWYSCAQAAFLRFTGMAGENKNACIRLSKIYLSAVSIKAAIKAALSAEKQPHEALKLRNV